MKVKISYTVDLDDVPDEVDFLIEKAKKNIEQSALSATELKETKDKSIEQAIKEIEIIRSMMMEADLILNDCGSILIGYLSAKYNDGGHGPERDEDAEDDV